MELLKWQGFISLVVLGICAAVALNGDKDVLPVIFLVLGAWLPSPTNNDSPRFTTSKTAKPADIKNE